MLLADAAVFRHVTSRLAHQPYRCVGRRLAAAGGEHRMLPQAASPRRRRLQATAGARLRAVGRRCPTRGPPQPFPGDAAAPPPPPPRPPAPPPPPPRPPPP